MTLQFLCGGWWPIVCPPSRAFLNFQKVCIPGAVCILLPDLTYPWWFKSLQLVHLMQDPRFYLILSPYPRYQPSSALPDTQIVALTPC